jgi:hypothetical protein
MSVDEALTHVISMVSWCLAGPAVRSIPKRRSRADHPEWYFILSLKTQVASMRTTYCRSGDRKFVGQTVACVVNNRR